MFSFHECPGGILSFNFRGYNFTRPGDEIEHYDLIDGQTYELPLAVAKHLNNNCWYPEYEYLPTDKGVQSGFIDSHGGRKRQYLRIRRKVKRASFQSMDFFDVESLKPDRNIVEVTYSKG